MDFRFTQDQQDLIDATKAVFDGENTTDKLRAMVNEDPTTPLWSQFHELGLVGFMVSEDNGGLDQPLVVMSGVAEAAGYCCLIETLVETAGIVLPLLEKTGRTDLVKKVLEDQKNVCFLTPLRPYVRGANLTKITLSTTENGVAEHDVSPFSMPDIWSIDDTVYSNKSEISGEQNPLADHHGAVLTAAQLIGLSQRMVDMSVDYAKDRHQFGKPIGSFQAIKHQLANVYTQIEFTRPMVHLAAIKDGRAAHTAKVAAIDTAMLAAETAIQVHGGMGYTFEVDLHLFMKRAWALCGEWGDRNYHMKKLEEMVLEGDEPLGAGSTF